MRLINSSEQPKKHDQLYLNDLKHQETLYDDKGDNQAAKNLGLYNSQDLSDSDSCDNGDVLSELGVEVNSQK